jgi:hypothetical protein
MPETFANSAKSTLSAGINETALSLTVSNGSKFPSSGQFRVKIEAEILLVTARSGNNFTVVRGQEGTSATTHASGEEVVHILTAGALEQLKVDAMGLVKDPVAKAVSTSGNLNISGSVGGQVDGVTINDMDWILLTAQTNPIENGLWRVNTGGPWTRVVLTSGANAAGFQVWVDQGSTNAKKRWECTSDYASAVTGTNSLTWRVVPGY